MPLHDKINKEHLQANGLLLSSSELELIQVIQEFMLRLREEAKPLLAQQKAIEAKKRELSEPMEVLESPCNAVDILLHKALVEHANDPIKFAESTVKSLELLKAKVKSTALSHFIDGYIGQIKQLDLKKFANSPALYAACYDLLNPTFTHYEEEFPDPLIYPELERHYRALADEENAICDKLDLIKSSLAKYKNDARLDFEIDEQYQITKISKRSEKLSFSVVFINSGAKTTPYALYRGKEDILGSGGFGVVKLCQNLETGEWCAAKIQKAVMRNISQSENAALATFARFKGEMSREDKYYSVQTLLHGVNLKKYLDNDQSNDLATRLLIAKKAISLVSNFHERSLHRDLKPENFVWDAEAKELYLCDFGLACPFNHEGIYNDLSGSGTFLAPEIDEANHRGRVNYSKKTDIYALGKTFEELFQGFELPQELTQMIQSMTHNNPGQRGGTMSTFLDTVTTAMEELAKPKPQQAAL